MVFLFKLSLICLGCAVLLFFGGSAQTLTLLMTMATLGFYFAKLLHCGSSAVLRHKVSLFSVPLAFILILYLNITGKIGTLTGSGIFESNFVLLLAAPFYILSIAAYVSDASSGRIRNIAFIDYIIYITLPFKLLAGPLESPGLLQQIQRLKPRIKKIRILVAWPWIVLGMFMKFVIANRLNPSSNLVAIDPVSALLTASVFELKFYFDFAGYSFMAYGLSLAIGLRINRNFEHPLFAGNVVLFWRRWHMSLGQFLGKYILLPNLKYFKNKNTKELFASSIFIVSALWHGGTANYLLWGLFHGLCYYFYIKFMKQKSIPAVLSIFSMLAFFVLGRFFATEYDLDRLIIKVLAIFNPFAYLQYDNIEALGYDFSDSEVKGILLALLFLVLERFSLGKFSLNRPYHFFRRPVVSLVLLIMIVFTSTGTGNLLYARI